MQPPQEAKQEDVVDEFVDVVTLEPSELGHIPDDDDGDAELCFLPTTLEPDSTADVAERSHEANDDSMGAEDKIKARKRMRVSESKR